MMEVTIRQGDRPDPAQGASHSPLPAALNEDTLGLGGIDPADPDPVFLEYVSDQFGVTDSTPPLPRGPLRDGNFGPYAELEYKDIGVQDSNEGHLVPHPPFWDSSLNMGYDADPDYGGGHNYLCECSLCEATYRDVGLSEILNLELPAAPASRCSEGASVSEFLDPSSLETKLQDASGPPFPTVYLPTVQQPPNSTDVLRLLKKHEGGRATCLWIHEGEECCFSSRIDLVKRHIKRVHFRLRPCVCQYCGRRFFNSYGLSLHYNSHTKAKPFICNFCGRGFASPSGKSHHRVHMHGYRVPRRPVPVAEGYPELSIAVDGDV